MSDLIERQAAVRKLKRMATQAYIDKLKGNAETIINCCIDVIERQIPSAQPDIIRCKDCKHHWTHRCMDSMPTEICELGQTFYDANVDFCSLAERRTDE